MCTVPLAVKCRAMIGTQSQRLEGEFLPGHCQLTTRNNTGHLLHLLPHTVSATHRAEMKTDAAKSLTDLDL